jgi:hypothetical protein
MNIPVDTIVTLVIGLVVILPLLFVCIVMANSNARNFFGDE